MNNGAQGDQPRCGGLTTRLRFCLSYLSSLVGDSSRAETGGVDAEPPARTPLDVAALVVARIGASPGSGAPASGYRVDSADNVRSPPDLDQSTTGPNRTARLGGPLVMVTPAGCSLHQEPRPVPSRPAKIVLTVERHNDRMDTDVPPSAPGAQWTRTPRDAGRPASAVPAKRTASALTALPHKKLAMAPRDKPASDGDAPRQQVRFPEQLSAVGAAAPKDGQAPPSTVAGNGPPLASTADGNSVRDGDPSRGAPPAQRLAQKEAASLNNADSGGMRRRPSHTSGAGVSETALPSVPASAADGDPAPKQGPFPQRLSARDAAARRDDRAPLSSSEQALTVLPVVADENTGRNGVQELHASGSKLPSDEEAGLPDADPAGLHRPPRRATEACITKTASPSLVAPAADGSATPEPGKFLHQLLSEDAADTRDCEAPPSIFEEIDGARACASDKNDILGGDTTGNQLASGMRPDEEALSLGAEDPRTLPHQPRGGCSAEGSETGSPSSGAEGDAGTNTSSPSATQIDVDMGSDSARPAPAQAGRRPATIPGAVSTQETTSARDEDPAFIPPMIAARPPVGNERRYVNFRVVDHPPVYHPWEADDSLSGSGSGEDSPTTSTRPEEEQPAHTPTPAEEEPAPEPSPPCGLCPQYDSGNMSPFPMIVVRLRRSFAGPAKRVRVHRECAEWAPEVYWENEDELVNVDKAYTRGRRIRCVVCNTSGATIGCYVDACRRSFHLRCLKLGNCRVDDEAYAVFCEEHANEATPALYRSSTGAWACRVPED